MGKGIPHALGRKTNPHALDRKREPSNTGAKKKPSYTGLNVGAPCIRQKNKPHVSGRKGNPHAPRRKTNPHAPGRARVHPRLLPRNSAQPGPKGSRWESSPGASRRIPVVLSTWLFLTVSTACGLTGFASPTVLVVRPQGAIGRQALPWFDCWLSFRSQDESEARPLCPATPSRSARRRFWAVVVVHLCPAEKFALAAGVGDRLEAHVCSGVTFIGRVPACGLEQLSNRYLSYGVFIVQSRF